MRKHAEKSASKADTQTPNLKQIIELFRTAPDAIITLLSPLPPMCQEFLMKRLEHHAHLHEETQSRIDLIRNLYERLHCVNRAHGDWLLSQREPTSGAESTPLDNPEQLLELFQHHFPNSCILQLQQVSYTTNLEPLDIDLLLAIFISLAGDIHVDVKFVQLLKELLHDLQGLHNQLQQTAIQTTMLISEIQQMKATLNDIKSISFPSAAAEKESHFNPHHEAFISTTSAAAKKSAEDVQTNAALMTEDTSDEISDLLARLELDAESDNHSFSTDSPLHLTPEQTQCKEQIEAIINGHALFPVEFSFTPEQFHDFTQQAPDFHTRNEFFFFLDSIINPSQENMETIAHFAEHEAAWDSALVQTKLQLGLTHDPLDLDYECVAAESKKTRREAAPTASSRFNRLSQYNENPFLLGPNPAFFQRAHRDTASTGASTMSVPLHEYQPTSRMSEEELIEQAILASLNPDTPPLVEHETDHLCSTGSAAASAHAGGETKSHARSSASAACSSSMQGEAKNHHRRRPVFSDPTAEMSSDFESHPGLSASIWPSFAAEMYQNNRPCQPLPKHERKELTQKLNNLIAIYGCNVPQLIDFKLTRIQFKSLKRLHDTSQFTTDALKNTLVPGLGSIADENQDTWDTLSLAISEQLTIHLRPSQPEWA